MWREQKIHKNFQVQEERVIQKKKYYCCGLGGSASTESRHPETNGIRISAGLGITHHAKITLLPFLIAPTSCRRKSRVLADTIARSQTRVFLLCFRSAQPTPSTSSSLLLLLANSERGARHCFVKLPIDYNGTLFTFSRRFQLANVTVYVGNHEYSVTTG